MAVPISINSNDQGAWNDKIAGSDNRTQGIEGARNEKDIRNGVFLISLSFIIILDIIFFAVP